MKQQKESLPEQYFDDVYRANTDPWNFEGSNYEKQKYAATIASLPKKRYKNIFEIGCSIGVLTSLLARHSSHLLAVDAAEAPLIVARQRLKNLTGIDIKKMAVPQEFPSEGFELIVLSEVAYYLNDKDLSTLRDKIVKQLLDGGHLVMVHWTPVVHDYPQTGDAVHDYFMELNDAGLKHLHHEKHDTYRLDVFEKM